MAQTGLGHRTWYSRENHHDAYICMHSAHVDALRNASSFA